MSEKDFETQEAIQEQSPTAARFENNDLSFDELSTMIGSTFVDIANLLSGDTDISDIIQAAREISTDHDVGIGIALVGKLVEINPSVDAAVARMALTEVLDRDVMAEPDGIANDEDAKDENAYADLYTKLHDIAEIVPDSMVGRVIECVDKAEELGMKLHNIEVYHETENEGIIDSGDLYKLDDEDKRYSAELATWCNEKDDYDIAVQSLRTEIGAVTSEVEVTDVEQTMVYHLVRGEGADPRGYDVQEVLPSIERYVEANPDTPLKDVLDKRAEYMEAKESLASNDTTEARVELYEKFRGYQRACDDVLCGKVVEERIQDVTTPDEGDVAAPEDDAALVDDAFENEADILPDNAVEASEPAETDTLVDGHDNDSAVETDEATAPDGDSAATNDAESEDRAEGGIETPLHNEAAVEPLKTQEMPTEDVESSVSIREDARAVLNYGVAERVYEHKEDYVAFNDGKDLVQSVYAKYDDMSKLAKDGAPMSRETCAIADELEQLGPKTGDVEHDSRIDELNAQKEDILLKAGAIIGSTQTVVERVEADAIFHFHRADREVMHGNDNPTVLEDLDTYSDVVKEFGSQDSADRGGIAAQYQDLYAVRNNARIKANTLHEQFEKATTYEEQTTASEEGFEARFEQDRAQWTIDSIFFEIEICRDGLEKYGEIDTPAPIEAKAETMGTDVVPDKVTQPAEPAKSEYDLAKEAYNDIRDKYSFRNTFVAYDRLSLDIEAYKTGEDGSKGRPVSGGDIAVDFMQFLHTNILESVVEVAMRTFLDKEFPAIEKVEIDVTTHDSHIEIMHNDKDFVPDRDFPGFANDRGVVSDAGRDAGVSADSSDNPAYGRFAGADTTKEVPYNDVGMRVFNCSPDGVDFTLTTGKVDDGKADVLNVPPLRLVEVGESFYIVDPFGETLLSNVITDVADPVANNDAIYPKFENLDIMASEDGKERIETYAAHKGISVDECKREIRHECMEKYVERGAVNVQDHADYIKEKLLPEALSDLSACRERSDFVHDAKEAFEARIEKPFNYDTPQDISRFEQFSDFLGDIDGKLGHLEEKLVDRIEKLTDTLNLYNDVKDLVRTSTTVEAKFEAIFIGDTRSYGKIDNPYYGIDSSSLRSIDGALEACGFKEDKEELFARFDGRGWPEAANVTYEWTGAIADMEPPSEEDVSMATELREAIQDIYPDYADRWPGLIDHSDHNAFDIDRFDAKEVLESAGVIMPDRWKIAEEAKVAAGDNPMHQLERLGMPQLIPYDRMHPNDFIDQEHFYETPIKTPTPEMIQDTINEIRDFGYLSGGTDLFGCRVVGPDFDWSTARPNEILRDADKDVFLVRVDAKVGYVEMTPQQASAYLHGPLDKADISTAFDKHLDIAGKPESTYSFGTDFLDMNRYRIDPNDLLSVYAEKLDGFLLGNDSMEHVDILADCLAGLKDTIVEHYTDMVADKIEKIVGDAIEKGSDVRVDAFIEKLNDSFENVIERVSGQDVDLRSVQLSNSVAEKLDAIAAKGVDKEDMAVIADIAKALDAVFDGYSDMLSAVSAACTKNDIDAGVTKDDDAAIVAAEESQDDTEVAQETEREAERDESSIDTVEDVRESISDVIDGLNDLEADKTAFDELISADVSEPEDVEKDEEDWME